MKLEENLFPIFKKIKVNEFKSKEKVKMGKKMIDKKSQEIIFESAKKIFEDYNYNKDLT